MNGVVYALLDPIDGIRYIGITTRPPMQRLYHHIYDAKRRRNYKARWIAKLLRNGQQPKMEILEHDVPEEELATREIAWIECLRAVGIALTNSTAGGEGIRHPTDEVRWKIGKANRGKIFSPERRAKLAEAQRGRRHSEYTKAKMRMSRAKQAPPSIETRQKISIGTKGRLRSPEASEKSATKLRGRKHSAETRAKKSAALAYLKKPIIDQNGVVYPGIAEAARRLNLRQSKIVCVLKGRRRSTGGYSFIYFTSPTN